MREFKSKVPELPEHIDGPLLGAGKVPVWLVLAASILPYSLPVVIDRIGHEISLFLKRKRVKKAKKKKEKQKKEKEKEKSKDAEVIEMTEEEFYSALQEGRLRIVNSKGEVLTAETFESEEDDGDATGSDEEE
jgi:hypothetical protein